MNKIFLRRGMSLLCAAALSMLLLAGCSTGGDSSQPAESTTGTTATTGPVTVSDASGAEVTISSAPQKIVVLPIWEAEMVIDMIGTDRIVGLSSYIDSEAITACADKAKAVKNRVSSEAEAILAQQPDLVLLDTFNDYDGSLAATLKGAGVTVLTLASPVTFDDIRSRLETVSKAVFAKEAGDKLIAEMNARLDAVKDKVAGVSEPMGVMYYEDYYSADGTSAGMLCAYGQTSPFNAIAEAAGARNVCTADNYSAVSKETVVNDWKPGLLVVPSIVYDANGQANDDHGASVISAIKQDAVLSTLPAVKNDKVIAMTEKYRGSTSHYMAYAVEELAKACYPELYQ